MIGVRAPQAYRRDNVERGGRRADVICRSLPNHEFKHRRTCVVPKWPSPIFALRRHIPTFGLNIKTAFARINRCSVICRGCFYVAYNGATSMFVGCESDVVVFPSQSRHVLPIQTFGD
jgi:hypothetical protein